MKKLCLFLLAALGFFMLNAQVLVATYDDQEIGDELLREIEPDESVDMTFIGINNVSSNDVTIKVVMRINQISEGNTAQICVNGACLNTLSSNPFTIAAGETFSKFDIQYSYENTNTTNLTISFVDANDESIVYKSFTVKYGVNLSTIQQMEKVIPLLVNAAPNPADALTNFRYSIPNKYDNARLIVRSPLGAIIKQIPLKVGASSKISFSTLDLTNGVYFYAIVADGKTLVTKKLIIKH